MMRGLLMGELIIVTGPPGAGKSTVSGLVADSFVSSVLIPADWFFGLWRKGAIDPWLPQALPQTSVAANAAAAATGAFARADCRVVYDGFIPPRYLPEFAAAAGLAALHYAVILPPVTTCVDRVLSRTRARVQQRGGHAVHAPGLHACRPGHQASHHGCLGNAGERLQADPGQADRRQPPVEGGQRQHSPAIDVTAETAPDVTTAASRYRADQQRRVVL
jgi:predicted ABC-type ATPase